MCCNDAAWIASLTRLLFHNSTLRCGLAAAWSSSTSSCTPGLISRLPRCTLRALLALFLLGASLSPCFLFRLGFCQLCSGWGSHTYALPPSTLPRTAPSTCCQNGL